MTTEELRREGGMVMAACKTMIDENLGFHGMCLMHWPADAIHPGAVAPGRWARMPDGAFALFNMIMGMGMGMGMESDAEAAEAAEAADIALAALNALRSVIQKTGCDGIILASDSWRFMLTDEGMRHAKEALEEARRSGTRELCRRGWMRREEAISVMAQSPADAVIMAHEYRRASNGRVAWLGGLHVNIMPQDEFEGRSKMFGFGEKAEPAEPAERPQ